MTAKPVVLREAAHQDVDATIGHYAVEAGEEVALNFIAALERAFRTIEARPRTGSPRYAQALDLPGLRNIKLARFPYLVFYIEREDHSDILRILHNRRDIPAGLLENR